MKLKIFLFFFTSCFFLVFSNSISIKAAPGGFFDGTPVKTTTGQFKTHWTDNNHLTYGSGLRYEAPNFSFIDAGVEPQNVTDFYFEVDNIGYTKVVFLNKSGGIIKTIESLSGYKNNSWNSVNVKDVASVRVMVNNSSGINPYLYEFDLKVDQPITPISVNSVNAVKTFDYSIVKLNWINPKAYGFLGVVIKDKDNGKEIATLSSSENSYTVSGLKPKTNYNFEVYSKYSDGSLATPVNVSVETDAIPEKVRNIKIDAGYTDAVVSWELPEIANYDGVILKIGEHTIELNETATTHKINGLNEDTEYDLEVLTKYKSGFLLEKDVLKFRTRIEIPEIDGGGFEKKPNGDYLFKWEKPTKGKVKVLIDGKEYKTIEASLLEILIPAKDMKYDILNNPKVSLVPISESGKEGIPSKPEPVDPSSGGTTFPFTVDELVKTGFNLLWFIGPILLLALSFLLFPKFRNLIFGVFRKDGGQSLQVGKDDRTDRERVNPVRKEHQEKREQHVGKEYLAKLEKNSEKVIAVSRAPRIPRDNNYRPIRESRMPRMPREPRPGREPRAGRER